MERENRSAPDIGHSSCVFFLCFNGHLTKNVNVWKQMLCLNATKLWTQQPNEVRLLVRRKVEKKAKKRKENIAQKRKFVTIYCAPNTDPN